MVTSKLYSKLTVIMSLLCLLFIAIIVRYPLSTYQVGNIDSYFYIPHSVLIKETATIPWLLDSFFSFIGLYPASDTSGFMILQAANYILIPSSSILISNIIFDFSVLVIMVIGFFLLARIYIQNFLAIIISTFAFITSYYIVRDTMLMLPGSRGVGAMFSLLFIFTLVFMAKKNLMRQIRWYVLLILLGFGAISNHLFALYFLPPLLLCVIIIIGLKRAISLVLKYFPKPNIISKKYFPFVFLLILGICFILPFLGITPVTYGQFYASAQMYKTESRFLPQTITDNPLVILAMSYFGKYSPLIALSALGVVLFAVKRNKRAVDLILFSFLLFSLLLMFELGYYILIFSIFLSLMAGYFTNVIFLKNEDKLLSFLIIICSFFCISWYILVVHKYGEVLYDLTYIIPLIGTFGLIYSLMKKKYFSSIENIYKPILGCSLIITSSFVVHSYNFDLIEYNKNASWDIPPNRPNSNIQSIALFQKNFANKEFFLANANNIYGEIASISESKSCLFWEHLMGTKNVRDNFTVTPVSWEYNRPKTFFSGKYTAGSLSIPDTSTPNSYLFLFVVPGEAIAISHNIGIHYAIEFIPQSGNFYFIGGKLIAKPEVPSPLLRHASKSFYVVYINEEYRNYYF